MTCDHLVEPGRSNQSGGSPWDKVKTHIWTLPRWFALPYIGTASIIGSYLAGGDIGNLNTWLAFLMVAFLMAFGHVMNTILDYYWTGLDRGETKERSAEKFYCGGQNVIEKGLAGPVSLWVSSTAWAGLALIISIYLSVVASGWISLFFVGGIVVPYWYSWGKFNYTHELSLGVGCGPLPILIGMFAIDPHADVQTGLLVSVPLAITLSFAGLALDEYPDAEANLKKGVKSIAYEVYRCGMNLSTYLLGWFMGLYIYQVWLMDTGRLAQWTALTFFLFPLLMAMLVFLNKATRFMAPPIHTIRFNFAGQDEHFHYTQVIDQKSLDYFSKIAAWLVALGGLYPLLVAIGLAIE